MKRLLLLLSLFGMIAQAMETAVITDFNGQIVQLTDAQRGALRSCETLKQMIEDTGINEVPFEGIAPFITNQNFQHLAQLIKDKNYLNQLMQVQDCIELFQFADYMKAPQESRSVLADRVYEPLRKKIKDTANEDEKANLELLCETVESNLSYYPHFKALVKDKPKILGTELDEARKPGVYVLSFPAISHALSLQKKLRSLEGIEILADCQWPKQIKTLCINYHDIENVDLAEIIKAFPNIIYLELAGNKIKAIDYKIAQHKLRVNLRSNPIQSISVANPHQLKDVTIDIDENCKPMVNFDPVPTNLNRWLEAFGAKSKMTLHTLYEHKAHLPICMLAACPWVGLGLAIPLTAVYLKYKEGSLENLVETIIPTYKDLYIPTAYGSLGLAGMCAIVETYKLRAPIYHNFNRAANQNKHVEINYVKPSHEVVHSYKYPSKYAYNLFGKN